MKTKKTSKILSKIIMIALLTITLFGCSNKEIKNQTSDFRSLSVLTYTGVIKVKRATGEEIDAYEGMALNNDDEVYVNSDSSLVIQIDNDKKLYAEPGTRFKLMASGSQGNTKTKIVLEEGCVLSRLDNKLNESEKYQVETVSASMSVKGTVFRVEIIKNDDGTVFNLVEVFDGKVFVELIGKDDNLILNPEQAALIKTGSNPSFITDDLIDKEQWEKPDKEIILLKDVASNGYPLLTIPYEKLPKATIEILISIFGDNRELTVKKETLELMKDEDEHSYFTISYIEPTCEKEGEEIIECEHCHIQKTIKLDKLEHIYVTDRGIDPTCETSGLTDGSHCANCGTVFVKQEVIHALGHDGDPCSRCGHSEQENQVKSVTAKDKEYQSITVSPDNTKTSTKNNILTIIMLILVCSILSIAVYLIIKYVVK